MDKPGEDLIVAVYRFFRSKGYSPIGAAYMVGSLLQESNLNPNILQPDGAGYGVAQWNDPEHAKEVLARLKKEGKASPKKIKELEDAMKATSKAQLIKFSQKNGRDYKTLAAQLNFVVQQNTKVTKLFKNAGTAAEAQAAVQAFEHYGIEGSHRFSNGETIYRNVWVVNKQYPKGKEFPEQAGTGLGGQVSPDAVNEVTGVLQQVQGKVLPSSKSSGGKTGKPANSISNNFGNQPPGAPSGGCSPSMPPPPPLLSQIPREDTPDSHTPHEETPKSQTPRFEIPVEDHHDDDTPEWFWKIIVNIDTNDTQNVMLLAKLNATSLAGDCTQPAPAPASGTPADGTGTEIDANPGGGASTLA